ncbi:MAG: VWA domain-containing protein [Bacteriovoracaceae bacterium]|nr:VWA domain-containing protein [Bacteriovoracaceae bacterium]
MKFMMIGVLTLAFGMNAFAEEDDFFRKKNAILFVLDISGSMMGAPLTKVKGVIARTIPKVNKKDYVGLISFSGCGHNYVKTQVPLTVGAHTKVVARAAGLRAGGATDLSLALTYAENEVARLDHGTCASVIVLTDGADSCGNKNAKDRAEDISTKYGNCKSVDVISIGMGDWEGDILDDIAKNGKGDHRRVEEPDDIEEQIKDILKKRQRDSKGKGGWEGDYKDKKDKKKGDDKKGDDPEEKKRSDERERERQRQKQKEGKGKGKGGKK